MAAAPTTMTAAAATPLITVATVIVRRRGFRSFCSDARLAPRNKARFQISMPRLGSGRTRDGSGLVARQFGISVENHFGLSGGDNDDVFVRRGASGCGLLLHSGKTFAPVCATEHRTLQRHSQMKEAACFLIGGGPIIQAAGIHSIGPGFIATWP